MDDCRKDRKLRALELIAGSFVSIAHSLAIIAANTTGISPTEKDAIQKTTGELKESHDRLVAATDANAVQTK